MKVLERCTHNKIVAITVWRGASNVEVSELESDDRLKLQRYSIILGMLGTSPDTKNKGEV